MPLYEFRCQACDLQFERLVRLNAANPECPSCASADTHKLLSAPAFRLKGSGWYETDFKSDKEKRRNLVDSEGSKSSDSGKKTEGEGKAKTESKSSDSAKSASTSDSKASSTKAKSDSGS